MKMLNRSAISIQLKQPFVDWINSLDGEDDEQVTLAEVNLEATTYLMPELEDEEALEDFVDERHFELLENELLSWEDDASLWPADMDRALFDEFLEVKLSFMVFDLDEQAPLLATVLDEAEAID
ncbi:hypothetical protein [Marinospirillum insulare]|uniref:Uncharacterized protein n=1 Tax=Marinospirillum insulare TaxID=217169 RepID=A0ABQ5ZW55_9GAMM|nr:hypothetical protein [Marinospirillum insulare]GLR63686.1 hypothetical protein GCM10007878_11210 [Marinospirillum insulare]